MDFKHNQKRIIAAVAQRSFELGQNTFCKLKPLFDHLSNDERYLDPRDFPNDHEIWWRLSQNTNPETIVPGMLMEPNLEPAHEISDDPEKSVYQAYFVSKEAPIEPAAGAEIFHPARETVRSILRLRGEENLITLQHVPSKRVYLHVEDFIYGPFLVSHPTSGDIPVNRKCRLKAELARDGRSVMYRIGFDRFQELGYRILEAELQCSADEKGAASAHLHTFQYEYLAPDVCAKIERDFASEWEQLDWESLSVKFSRMAAAAKTFSRGDRQQVRDLVKRLESTDAATSFADEFKTATKDLFRLSDEAEAAFRDLAVALSECSLWDKERMEEAKKKYLDDWLSTQKADLEREILAAKDELEQLKADVAEYDQRIQRKKEQLKQTERDERKKLNAQLEKDKAKQLKEIDDARRAAESANAREAAKLEGERKRIESARDEVKQMSEKSAAEYIAMFPFLKELGFGRAAAPADLEEPAKKQNKEPFAIPATIHVPSPAAKMAMNENAFLDTLREYAAGEGFVYDPADLRRFHLSVLCEGLTILEGPAGVGKSSLARLYGDVLAGANALPPRDGTHIVHVSPSWMERSDLLGYVNTVTGEFSPSETGLYRQLIMASEDFRRHGPASGLYPVCLDEMNLAQVEYYFSDFMQILELPEKKRFLKCFSRDAVSENALFKNYSEIMISPGVKFIGTVNFDETTRRLSSRLLDRTNLIFLGDSPAGRATRRMSGGNPGCGVSLGTYESWRRDGAIPQEAEALLAEIADPLKKLGIAASPRVLSAMGRYIASAVALAGGARQAAIVAADEQLAQRILSKIRAITSAQQKKAVDAIASALDKFNPESYSPSRSAIERIRAKERFFNFENE